MELALALSALLLQPIAPAPVPPPATPEQLADQLAEDDVEPIVVTGSRTPPVPKAEAIVFFRRLCFDPTRLEGLPAIPADDPDWRPLDEEARAKFGISDPAVPAATLIDRARGHRLIVKAERLSDSGRIAVDRCTMLVVGGAQPKQLADQLSDLFGGPPTRWHVGERDGSPKIEGWEQWLWTAMPSTGSSKWETINRDRKTFPRGTWIAIANSNLFFSAYDYVLIDMKSRKGAAEPVTLITLEYRRLSKRKRMR